MHGNCSKFTFIGMLFAVASVVPAQASICDAAAQRAAAEIGVPVEVMLTITRLETGRGKNADPWPWTINHAGNGSWFPSEDDARSYVFSKIKRGVSNIDIGCFQINYRWHADGFRSLDDMFNPDQNALYAAQFLSNLHHELGSWTEAVGAYHSRTPKFAERYKAKYSSLRPKVAELDLPPVKSTPKARKHLFGNSGKARPGSVFVTDASDVRPFIQFNRTN